MPHGWGRVIANSLWMKLRTMFKGKLQVQVSSELQCAFAVNFSFARWLWLFQNSGPTAAIENIKASGLAGQTEILIGHLYTI